MKKIFLSLLLAVGFCAGASAQQTAKSTINEELKKELTTKLSMTDEAAAKVVVIEETFYTAITTAAAMPTGTIAQQKAKDKKTHEAHVTRRENLMALPLTGRQMEDVVVISDRLHQTEKKAS